MFCLGLHSKLRLEHHALAVSMVSLPACVHPCVPCVSLNCLLAVFPQKSPPPQPHHRGNNLFQCDFEKMILFFERSMSSYSFFGFHKKDSHSLSTFILLTAMLVSSIGPFLLPENQKPASLVCNSSPWQVISIGYKMKDPSARPSMHCDSECVSVPSQHLAIILLAGLRCPTNPG